MAISVLQTAADSGGWNGSITLAGDSKVIALMQGLIDGAGSPSITTLNLGGVAADGYEVYYPSGTSIGDVIYVVAYWDGLSSGLASMSVTEADIQEVVAIMIEATGMASGFAVDVQTNEDTVSSSPWEHSCGTLSFAGEVLAHVFSKDISAGSQENLRTDLGWTQTQTGSSTIAGYKILGSQGAAPTTFDTDGVTYSNASATWASISFAFQGTGNTHNLLRIPRTSQPPPSAKIDWSNPITNGLRFVQYGGRAVNVLDNAQPTTLNNVENIPTVKGLAVDYQGSNPDVYSDTYFNGETEFSVIALVHPDSLTEGSNENRLLIRKASAVSGSYGFSSVALDIRSVSGANPHQVLFKAGPYGEAAAQTAWGGDDVPTGEWSLISGSYRSGGYAECFLNGIRQDIASSTTSYTMPSGSTQQILVGGRADSTDDFNGQIALFACWARKLESEEMASLADNPWQIFEPIWVPWFKAAAAAGVFTPLRIPHISQPQIASAQITEADIGRGIVSCYLPGQSERIGVVGPQLTDVGTGSALTRGANIYGPHWTGDGTTNAYLGALSGSQVDDVVGSTLMVIARANGTDTGVVLGLTDATASLVGPATSIYTSTNILSGSRRADGGSGEVISSSPAHNGEWFIYIKTRISQTLGVDWWNVGGVLGGATDTTDLGATVEPVPQTTVGTWYDTTTYGLDFDGDIALAVVWNRYLTPEEAVPLLYNPWQIFEPIKVPWFPGAAAGGGTTFTTGTPFSLTITENAQTIQLDQTITLGVDSLTITEQSQTIQLDTVFTTALESLAITENQQTIQAYTDTVFTTSAPDTLVVTENQQVVQLDQAFTTSLATLGITELSFTVQLDQSFTTSVQNLAITELPMSLSADTVFTIGTDALSITENQQQVQTDYTFTLGTDSFTISELPATIQLDHSILTSLAELNISTFTLTIGGFVVVVEVPKGRVRLLGNRMLGGRFR